MLFPSHMFLQALKAGSTSSGGFWNQFVQVIGSAINAATGKQVCKFNEGQYLTKKDTGPLTNDFLCTFQESSINIYRQFRLNSLTFNYISKP